MLGAGLADLRHFSRLCLWVLCAREPWHMCLGLGCSHSPLSTTSGAGFHEARVPHPRGRPGRGFSPDFARAPQGGTTARALPPTLSPTGDGPRAVQRFCPVFGPHLELLQVCGLCISVHWPADLQPQVRAAPLPLGCPMLPTGALSTLHPGCVGEATWLRAHPRASHGGRSFSRYQAGVDLRHL